MVKVITYGTYDHLHYGHISLLERAKKLGDYLIVGITSEDFDKTRGKINVRQSLEERIAAVRNTGIADKIIVEEYEGQKIDDIRKYDIDIFTVGSDWIGYFDYLNNYCNVVYLPRTEGVSSSDIRMNQSCINVGLVGYSSFLKKFYKESKYINSIKISSLCSSDTSKLDEIINELELVTKDYDELLKHVDAVYIHSHPKYHYEQCKHALLCGKHVLCESPLAMSYEECEELISLANKKSCILMEGIRTAYLTAFNRLLLLLKGGKIGNIVSIDATCTSLKTIDNFGNDSVKWGAFEAWGPTSLLPIFQIFGTKYNNIEIFTAFCEENTDIDGFTKLDFQYSDAVASVKVGTSIKSESELIISGTRGYAYIPAPWWKTDYFELRFEESSENKRYFYQVEGEGIRYELVQFSSAIQDGRPDYYISREITKEISNVMNNVYSKYIGV